MSKHQWPATWQHLWGPWRQKTKAGTGRPVIQYRTCVHPDCHEFEEREAPKS
jgi:hypothetical protein